MGDANVFVSFIDFLTRSGRAFRACWQSLYRQCNIVKI